MAANTNKPVIEPTDQQKSDYRENGVVLLPGVFAEHQLAALGSAIERTLQSPRNYFHYRLLWPEDQAFAEFCQRSSAPRIAASLLNSSQLSLLFDQFFYKFAASETATGWHNDQPYWPVKGPDLITLWIALDRIDETNGAMEFIRASHRWERRFAPFIADKTGGFGHYLRAPDADLEALPDFDAERDQHDIVQFHMQAGDVLAFNGMIVHSAQGNRSKRRRRAYAIRYVGENSCYWPTSASAEFLLDSTLKPGDRLLSERFPQVVE